MMTEDLNDVEQMFKGSGDFYKQHFIHHLFEINSALGGGAAFWKVAGLYLLTGKPCYTKEINIIADGRSDPTEIIECLKSKGFLFSPRSQVPEIIQTGFQQRFIPPVETQDDPTEQSNPFLAASVPFSQTVLLGDTTPSVEDEVAAADEQATGLQLDPVPTISDPSTVTSTAVDAPAMDPTPDGDNGIIPDRSIPLSGPDSDPPVEDLSAPGPAPGDNQTEVDDNSSATFSEFGLDQPAVDPLTNEDPTAGGNTEIITDTSEPAATTTDQDTESKLPNDGGLKSGTAAEDHIASSFPIAPASGVEDGAKFNEDGFTNTTNNIGAPPVNGFAKPITAYLIYNIFQSYRDGKVIINPSVDSPDYRRALKLVIDFAPQPSLPNLSVSFNSFTVALDDDGPGAVMEQQLKEIDALGGLGSDQVPNVIKNCKDVLDARKGAMNRLDFEDICRHKYGWTLVAPMSLVRQLD